MWELFWRQRYEKTMNFSVVRFFILGKKCSFLIEQCGALSLSKCGFEYFDKLSNQASATGNPEFSVFSGG